jgi:hypothetical protein
VSEPDIRVVFGRLSRSPLKKRGEFDFVCENVEGSQAIAGLVALCPGACGDTIFLDFSATGRFGWNGSEEQPSVNEPIVCASCGPALEWRLVRGVWITPP